MTLVTSDKEIVFVGACLLVSRIMQIPIFTKFRAKRHTSYGRKTLVFFTVIRFTLRYG